MGQVKKGRNREGRQKKEKGKYIDLKPNLLGKLRPMELRSQSAPHIHRRGNHSRCDETGDDCPDSCDFGSFL